MERITLLTNYNFFQNEKLESLIINQLGSNIEFENSSNAKSLLAQISSKKSEILFYEKEFFPNLNFYSKYDVYGYDSDSYRNSIEELKENSYRFGINLTINLFDGFKTITN